MCESTVNVTIISLTGYVLQMIIIINLETINVKQNLFTFY